MSKLYHEKQAKIRANAMSASRNLIEEIRAHKIIKNFFIITVINSAERQYKSAKFFFELNPGVEHTANPGSSFHGLLYLFGN